MKGEIKLLYVDDEPINLMLFEANFKRNYTIITAASGTEAMKILNKNSGILVVISDMNMPEMDGIQFIGLAKKKHPEIHYMILSGYEITEEIEEALTNKLIYKYFRKPFKLNEIKGAIEEALK